MGRCLLIALVAVRVVSGMGIVCVTDSPTRFGAIDLRTGYAAGEFPLWSIARAIGLIPSSDKKYGYQPKRNVFVHARVSDVSSHIEYKRAHIVEACACALGLIGCKCCSDVA